MKTFYVVRGSTSDYDYGTEWVVGVTDSKSAAKALADKAQKWVDKHQDAKTLTNPYDPYYRWSGIDITYSFEECKFFRTMGEFKQMVPKIKRLIDIEIQKSIDKITAQQKKK